MSCFLVIFFFLMRPFPIALSPASFLHKPKHTPHCISYNEAFYSAMYCGINIGSLYFKYAFGFYNKLIKQKQSDTFYMLYDSFYILHLENLIQVPFSPYVFT